MKVVAIVGSREFPLEDFVLIEIAITELPRDTLVISGGAKGVDQFAVRFARLTGLRTKVFTADWANEGLSAGPRRNLKMAHAADEVIAFWDGESKGTANMIKATRSLGKPIIVVKPRSVAKG